MVKTPYLDKFNSLKGEEATEFYSEYRTEITRDSIRLAGATPLDLPPRKMNGTPESLFSAFNILTGAAQARFYNEHRETLLQFMKTPSARQ